MCVLAGYIGNEKAAPVLLEMLRREEGLDAGFYTGIATVHDGKLHYRKVVGDIETLLAETDALQLPGTIGIAHSRTPSGGGREWAHPFTDDGEQLAYIANGSPGKYLDSIDLAAIGNRLLEHKSTFKSAQDEKVGNSPTLANGKTIHISDLVCQLIAHNFQKQQPSSEGLLKAAIAAYEEAAGEIVGLSVHAKLPDTIIITRHNQPMEIGRDSAGAMYLATTTLAFPAVEWQMRMPPIAGAICRRNGNVQIVPFLDQSRLIPIGPAPSAISLATVVHQFIQENNPCTMPQLAKAIEPLWPEGQLRERSIILYELLAALKNEGKISFHQERVTGMFDQGTVPRTYITFTE